MGFKCSQQSNYNYSIMLCSGESPNGNEVYNVVHAQVVKRVLFTNLLSEI